MFIHYLAGCIIFFLGAWWHDWHVTSLFLLGGALCGAFPDYLSLAWGNIKINKYSHKHRDNLSHSLLLPIICFIAISLFDSKFAFIIGLALLSHPLLDTFGIGWGVKLFYPFSDVTVKIGHIKHKWFYSQKEIDDEAGKYGDNNWIRNLYFRPTPTAFTEWASFILTISMICLIP